MTEGKRPIWLSAIPLAALACVVAGGSAIAQTDEEFAARWRGDLMLGQQKMGVIFELQQDSTGAWVGTVKSEEAPERSLPLENVVIAERTLAFELQLPGLPGDLRYDGALDDDEIKGQLRTIGEGARKEYKLNLKRMKDLDLPKPLEPTPGTPVVSYDATNPLSGTWIAKFPDSEDDRELRLELGRDSRGTWSGTLIDSSAEDVTILRDIAFGENTLSFNFRPQQAGFLASFWGRYVQEEDVVRGSLSLGGRSTALVFERLGLAPGTLPDEFAKPPLPRKHLQPFAAVARFSYWQPLYIVKEGVRNINDITSSSVGFDAGARWYMMDTFAVQARYFYGGLGFDSQADYLALFSPSEYGDNISPRLISKSYLQMHGWEFGIQGFIGPVIMPDSRFNPFFTFAVGKTTWELGRNGRGSERIVSIFEVPLEGTDWQFSGGLGSEYAINERFGVELEWLWSYSLTEDTDKWTDEVHQWTNTHAYRLNVGVLYWF